MVDDVMEQEANYFAMCLLIPEHMLVKDVREIGGIDLCDPRPIQKLAKRYNVSEAMMAMRLSQLAEKQRKAATGEEKDGWVRVQV